MPVTILLIFAKLGAGSTQIRIIYEGTIMSKMKTRKAAAKRFKQTGTGKFVHHRAGGRHILTKKSSKRKRRLCQPKVASKTEVARLKSCLPYGPK